MNINKILILSTIAAMAIVGCSRSEFEPSPSEQDFEKTPIVLSGDISQVYETRANDSGFADGDAIGVYITDYDGENAASLSNTGNRADNMKYTFDEAAYKWNPIREVYWKDKTTHIDVYGYYPYQSVDNVSAMPLTVATAQNDEGTDGNLGGYEASDFLWGKAEDVAPTASRVNIEFRHRMAGMRITLVEGTGFSDGEWAAADKQVLITGIKNNATVNLSTGVVTANGDMSETGITPYHSGSDWRAVVAPQEIAAGATLIKVTVGGYAYKHIRTEATTLAAGKQHNFTIKVNKRAAGDLEFTLSGESVTAWENDPVSHSAVSKTYIVINVDKPGTLDSCIIKKGLDMTKIQNLKLTGEINSRDFAVMNKSMSLLKSLNLKEVKIAATTKGWVGSEYFNDSNEDEIPTSAFQEKTTLTSIILPDRLTKIGYAAFSSCNLTGSLVIPNGVKEIEDYAFNSNSFSGGLTLPESLVRIGVSAFNRCGFSGRLSLPSHLQYIGNYAFDSDGFTGSLYLPESLTYIGELAFAFDKFTGSLSIPQGVTTIKTGAFINCSFNGNLILHNGIVSIEKDAFSGCAFRGVLDLPDELVLIGDSAFAGTGFTGTLVFPSELQKIGDSAFSGCGFIGNLEIPRSVISIGTGAFSGCSGINGVIFNNNVKIGSSAFKNCFDIASIISHSDEPPVVESGAFDGVAKDNFTVEVPETAVTEYKMATGWNEFKRISAYKNFSLRPQMLSAINTKVSRTLTLYADNAWEVQSKPDWIDMSQTSGDGKAELTVTFDEMASGATARTGEVVFKLNDTDYTSSLAVSQYDYQYAEDEIVTLQSASKGNGINLMFLGDGFSAKDVSEGTLLKDINEAVDYFFAIEPYKSYRNYFNVYAGVSVSTESGIGSVNTIVYNKFNTTGKSDAVLGTRNGESGFSDIMKYACKAPSITEETLSKTLIVIIPNTTSYNGSCYLYSDGLAIVYCPMSNIGYPYDFRGVVQKFAGGEGFGKLGDEGIYVNNFIDACICTYPHVREFNNGKMLGWYDNLSLSGKTNEVPWSNLIYHEKYRDVVDIYEGGFYHTRGVFRSEYRSCMDNMVPYYNSISRESIVRRIKQYAGEEFDFDDFVANDSFDVNVTTAAVKSSAYEVRYPGAGPASHAPVFMGERPRLSF